MPKVIAIELNEEITTIVKAEISQNSLPYITDTFKFDTNNVFKELENRKNSLILDASNVLIEIPNTRVLFNNISLPFLENKKVKQVLPLQLKDVIPFELEDFIIDFKNTGKLEDGSYKFLTSITPKKDIIKILNQFASIGIDPKLLTPKSNSLITFKEIFKSNLEDSFLMIYATKSDLSISIYVKNHLTYLKHFHLKEELSLFNAITELKCLLARVYKENQIIIKKCYVIGSEIQVNFFRKFLNLETSKLNIDNTVKIKEGIDQCPDDIAWAIGLFLNENNNKLKNKSLNFRRDEFSFRPLVQSLLTGLKEQLFYIVTFISIFLIWGISSIISTFSLNYELDKRKLQEISSIPDSKSIKTGEEVKFMEDKIKNLEYKLKAFGSLSSLSPLESLKELSIAIDRSINIKVDSIQITREHLEIKGSVSNYKELGRLNSLLESRKELFCKVLIDSKEQTFSTKRIMFSADIKLCKK